MPNIKSNKKRMITTQKRRAYTSTFKSSLRTALKNVETAESKEAATEYLTVAHKKLDKALSKGIVHKNYVANQKSRLAKLVNSL
jgi:small subunit ribosomal protein S20